MNKKIFQVLFTLLGLVSLFSIESGHAKDYCAAEGSFENIGGVQVFVCPNQGATDPCLYKCDENER